MRDKFASNSDMDTELDWIEPSLCLSNSRMLQPYPADRVYDAFHLLQTEPSIQVPLLLTLTKRSNGMEIRFKI